MADPATPTQAPERATRDRSPSASYSDVSSVSSTPTLTPQGSSSAPAEPTSTITAAATADPSAPVAHSRRCSIHACPSSTCSTPVTLAALARELGQGHVPGLSLSLHSDDAAEWGGATHAAEQQKMWEEGTVESDAMDESAQADTAEPPHVPLHLPPLQPQSEEVAASSQHAAASSDLAATGAPNHPLGPSPPFTADGIPAAPGSAPSPVPSAAAAAFPQLHRCRSSSCATRDALLRAAQRAEYESSPSFDPAMDACATEAEREALRASRARTAAMSARAQAEAVERILAKGRERDAWVAEQRRKKEREEMAEVGQFKRAGRKHARSRSRDASNGPESTAAASSSTAASSTHSTAPPAAATATATVSSSAPVSYGSTLYYRSLIDAEVQAESLRAFAASQYSFKPALNARSMAMARRVSAKALAAVTLAEETAAAAAEAREEAKKKGRDAAAAERTTTMKRPSTARPRLVASSDSGSGSTTRAGAHTARGVSPRLQQLSRPTRVASTVPTDPSAAADDAAATTRRRPASGTRASSATRGRHGADDDAAAAPSSSSGRARSRASLVPPHPERSAADQASPRTIPSVEAPIDRSTPDCAPRSRPSHPHIRSCNSTPGMLIDANGDCANGLHHHHLQQVDYASSQSHPPSALRPHGPAGTAAAAAAATAATAPSATSSGTPSSARQGEAETGEEKEEQKGSTSTTEATRKALDDAAPKASPVRKSSSKKKVAPASFIPNPTRLSSTRRVPSTSPSSAHPSAAAATTATTTTATTTAPFAVSGAEWASARREWAQRRQAAAVEAQLAECTFAPVTLKKKKSTRLAGGARSRSRSASVGPEGQSATVGTDATSHNKFALPLARAQQIALEWTRAAESGAVPGASPPPLPLPLGPQSQPQRAQGPLPPAVVAGGSDSLMHPASVNQEVHALGNHLVRQERARWMKEREEYVKAGGGRLPPPPPPPPSQPSSSRKGNEGDSDAATATGADQPQQQRQQPKVKPKRRATNLSPRRAPEGYAALHGVAVPQNPSLDPPPSAPAEQVASIVAAAVPMPVRLPRKQVRKAKVQQERVSKRGNTEPMRAWTEGEQQQQQLYVHNEPVPNQPLHEHASPHRARPQTHLSPSRSQQDPSTSTLARMYPSTLPSYAHASPTADPLSPSTFFFSPLRRGYGGGSTDSAPAPGRATETSSRKRGFDDYSRPPPLQQAEPQKWATHLQQRRSPVHRMMSSPFASMDGSGLGHGASHAATAAADQAVAAALEQEEFEARALQERLRLEHARLMALRSPPRSTAAAPVPPAAEGADPSLHRRQALRSALGAVVGNLPNLDALMHRSMLRELQGGERTGEQPQGQQRAESGQQQSHAQQVEPQWRDRRLDAEEQQRRPPHSHRHFSPPAHSYRPPAPLTQSIPPSMQQQQQQHTRVPSGRAHEQRGDEQEQQEEEEEEWWEKEEQEEGQEEDGSQEEEEDEENEEEKEEEEEEGEESMVHSMLHMQLEATVSTVPPSASLLFAARSLLALPTSAAAAATTAAAGVAAPSSSDFEATHRSSRSGIVADSPSRESTSQGGSTRGSVQRLNEEEEEEEELEEEEIVLVGDEDGDEDEPIENQQVSQESSRRSSATRGSVCPRVARASGHEDRDAPAPSWTLMPALGSGGNLAPAAAAGFGQSPSSSDARSRADDEKSQSRRSNDEHEHRTDTASSQMSAPSVHTSRRGSAIDIGNNSVNGNGVVEPDASLHCPRAPLMSFASSLASAIAPHSPDASPMNLGELDDSREEEEISGGAVRSRDGTAGDSAAFVDAPRSAFSSRARAETRTLPSGSASPSSPLGRVEKQREEELEARKTEHEEEEPHEGQQQEEEEQEEEEEEEFEQAHGSDDPESDADNASVTSTEEGDEDGATGEEDAERDLAAPPSLETGTVATPSGSRVDNAPMVASDAASSSTSAPSPSPSLHRSSSLLAPLHTSSPPLSLHRAHSTPTRSHAQAAPWPRMALPSLTPPKLCTPVAAAAAGAGAEEEESESEEEEGAEEEEEEQQPAESNLGAEEDEYDDAFDDDAFDDESTAPPADLEDESEFVEESVEEH